LSEEAVTALAAGISGATFLSKLSLRGCSMSAESLRIIGNALAGNSTLMSLDLSHQSHEVAHPLCGSHWRSRLSTGRTSSIGLLSRRPLLPVFEALHRNRTLQELIVLGIDIFNSDVEELCACVERSGNHVICHVRHTGLNSEPLAIKLESLLSQNRSKCRGDLFARTAVVKHSDPIQLPPSGKDKDARPKPQAQMENKIKECTEPMSNCQTPATPAVLGKVKTPGKGKNNEKTTASKMAVFLLGLSPQPFPSQVILLTPAPLLPLRHRFFIPRVRVVRCNALQVYDDVALWPFLLLLLLLFSPCLRVIRWQLPVLHTCSNISLAGMGQREGME
ncbi:hypothetical protein TcCL_ESM04586, partial [Trypanosoma cruzi]